MIPIDLILGKCTHPVTMYIPFLHHTHMHIILNIIPEDSDVSLVKNAGTQGESALTLT